MTCKKKSTPELELYRQYQRIKFTWHFYISLQIITPRIICIISCPKIIFITFECGWGWGLRKGEEGAFFFLILFRSLFILHGFLSLQEVEPSIHLKWKVYLVFLCLIALYGSVSLNNYKILYEQLEQLYWIGLQSYPIITLHVLQWETEGTWKQVSSMILYFESEVFRDCTSKCSSFCLLVLMPGNKRWEC